MFGINDGFLSKIQRDLSLFEAMGASVINVFRM